VAKKYEKEPVKREPAAEKKETASKGNKVESE